MSQAPPQYSPDGKYWWDGASWNRVRPVRGLTDRTVIALLLAGFVVLGLFIAVMILGPAGTGQIFH